MAYTATLQKLAENLNVAYQNTIFSHSGDVGDSREKAVIDYLKKVMAHKYGFQSGEVFDEEDNTSGQVDIIIYDNLFSTVFTDGTDKILAPVESTYGVVSVKSKMGTKELDHAIEGILKYDSLRRPKSKEGMCYIMPDFAFASSNSIRFPTTSQQNINCIFAFDTTVAEATIIQRIKESNLVDLLVVPGKFCTVGRLRPEVSTQLGDKTLCDYMVRSDKSVALFIVLLQMYLGGNHLIGRDIHKLASWLMQQGQIVQSPGQL
jgi:hypothetical protein